MNEHAYNHDQDHYHHHDDYDDDDDDGDDDDDDDDDGDGGGDDDDDDGGGDDDDDDDVLVVMNPKQPGDFLWSIGAVKVPDECLGESTQTKKMRASATTQLAIGLQRILNQTFAFFASFSLLCNVGSS